MNDTDEVETERPIPILARMAWLLVMTTTVIAAGLWLILSPGGFPLGHPRFGFNRILPLVGLAGTFAAMGALRRSNRTRLARLLPAWPAFLVAVIVTGWLVFPRTTGRLWPVPAGAACVLGGLTAWTLRGAASRRLIAGPLVVGGALGAFSVAAQRPPAPDTRPTGAPARLSEPFVDQPANRGLVRLGPTAAVHTSDGSLSLRIAPLRIEVRPLLTFLSRSPDGAWVLLARASERAEPVRRLMGVETRNKKAIQCSYVTAEIGSNRLVVEHEASEGRTRIDALSGVDRPVHSHLNSYTDLEIQGHRQLSLAFSPCPDTPIEVMPFEYPVGRPLRIACLDDDGLFRVVEARTGEKGPFRTLASGRLARGQPLSILLLDEGKPVARITLDDWSAQVGTALSPTAGSGLPVNSIEFSRAGDDAASSVHVFISLASTSVGRGFDSVTHAPGVYRNRIRVEPAIANAPPQ